MRSNSSDLARGRLRKLIGDLGGPAQVAAGIGYTPDAVRGWLRRRSGPSFDALLRLHHDLDVDVNWILSGRKRDNQPT